MLSIGSLAAPYLVRDVEQLLPLALGPVESR
jgi:hypothetical protein